MPGSSGQTFLDPFTLDKLPPGWGTAMLSFLILRIF